jgi:Lsr2
MHDLEEWWVVVEATREFELDGSSYEIDLCGEHVTEFDDALKPYLDGARKRRPDRQLGRRSSR